MRCEAVAKKTKHYRRDDACARRVRRKDIRVGAIVVTLVQWVVMNKFVGVSVAIIDERGIFALRRNEADSKRRGLRGVSLKQQSIG